MSSRRFCAEIVGFAVVYPAFVYALCMTVLRSTEKTPRTAGVSIVEAGSPARDKAVSAGTQPAHLAPSRVNPTNTGPRRNPAE